jgi:U32 family peptidase
MAVGDRVSFGRQMSKTEEMNGPELLSPAGDWEAMRAAVANGADAVYFGLSAFNARHRAANFAVEELPEILTFLHHRNVRGYVAMNTLIFSDELEEAARFIGAIAAARVDAIIVQDLGLAELARRICPGLAVHGSTQMTLTEPLGVEFVRSLGVGRVILARELSTGDIAKIAAESAVPVEVFVHGALCVSYSGQCLTSESIGQRSANRGQCAQACRLPYELIVDGDRREMGDKAYLLSPQDLAAFDLVKELAEIGVKCLKIEGRLKSAHYVAATTQVYRAAVDAAREAKPFDPSAQQRMDLAQSFSRGFTHGFLDGVNHQKLVHARFPKSRGVRAGSVVGKSERGVFVQLERGANLKIGDGVVFDEGHPEQDEQGGRIVSAEVGRGGRIAIGFYRGDVSLHAVSVGSIVWKTDDPEIRKRLERSFSRDRVARRIAIGVHVKAIEGEPLRISVRDEAGNCVEVGWERNLERAVKFPMTREIFREQFGRLGDTPLELGEVFVNGDGAAEFPPVMIPKSVLNDLRRQASGELMRRRDGGERLINVGALAEMRGEIDRNTEDPLPNPPPEYRGRGNMEKRIYVLARTMEQLQAALKWRPPTDGVEFAAVYCEFEDIRKYPDAVRMARDAGVKIGLATIRIVKPPEQGLLKLVAAAEPDLILIRNLAGLCLYRDICPEIPLVADYSLNVSNELTAAILKRHGVVRMTPSYDLNWSQLSAMLGRFPVEMFEVVIHQHMPMFHMEHCIPCFSLSNGKDYRDCGRPCEKHQISLRDRVGHDHPLVVDVGCRNTIYNGQAQSGAAYIPKMLALDLRHFRIELLRETADGVKPILDQYALILGGMEAPKQAIRSLKVLNQLGVTPGTLAE